MPLAPTKSAPVQSPRMVAFGMRCRSPRTVASGVRCRSPRTAASGMQVKVSGRGKGTCCQGKDKVKIKVAVRKREARLLQCHSSPWLAAWGPQPVLRSVQAHQSSSVARQKFQRDCVESFPAVLFNASCNISLLLQPSNTRYEPVIYRTQPKNWDAEIQRVVPNQAF
eukprot:354510-Chlamydomonas_euryale.AAC.8